MTRSGAGLSNLVEVGEEWKHGLPLAALIDSNTPFSGFTSASSNGALTGTYAVGSDNRGYLLAGPVNTTPTVFAIAGGNLDTNSHFSDFALAEMDDVGPAPNYPRFKHGGGHCFEQNTTTSLTGLRPSGGYVFLLKGEDDQGNLVSLVGSIQLNSSTGAMSGVQDMADAGACEGEMTFTGTSTAADTWGRITTVGCEVYAAELRIESATRVSGVRSTLEPNKAWGSAPADRPPSVLVRGTV
jgi:hypothetical protein